MKLKLIPNLKAYRRILLRRISFESTHKICCYHRVILSMNLRSLWDDFIYWNPRKRKWQKIGCTVKYSQSQLYKILPSQKLDFGSNNMGWKLLQNRKRSIYVISKLRGDFCFDVRKQIYSNAKTVIGEAKNNERFFCLNNYLVVLCYFYVITRPLSRISGCVMIEIYGTGTVASHKWKRSTNAN